MGLAYWSNRINSWEEFPSTEGTINASLAGEFSIFQRKLVTDFLAWQASIVNEYKQDKQFVTHNFDFDWRGYSFGIQPDVDIQYAKGLFNLAIKQKEEDARQSVAELKRLVDKHLDHQKINEQYAMGFVNLYNKQKEEDFPI